MNYGKNTISDLVLKEQDNLVLTFPVTTSESNVEVDIVAFRVGLSNSIFQEIDTLPFMDDEGTLDINKLGVNGHQEDSSVSSPGESVFRISDDSPFTVYHFGIGMKPSGYKLFISNPAGNIVNGLEYDVSPDVDSDYGYYPSELMGYEDPSVVTEQIKINDVSIHVGLKNDSGEKNKPIMQMVGKAYELMPITNEDKVKDMICRNEPAAIKTFGAMNSTGTNIPDEWPEKLRMDIESINKAFCGVRK